MKLLIPLLLIIAFQVSGQDNTGFVINGQITGVVDGTKVYLFNIDNQIIIDSANTVSGNFIIKGKVDYPITCWIKCNDEYAIIMLENANIKFSSPLKDMHLYASASGGKEQSLLSELDKIRQPYNIVAYHAYDSLINNQFKNNDHKKILINHVNNYQDTAQNIYIAFGISHPNSYLGLDILYRNRKSIGKDSIQALMAQMDTDIKASVKAKSLTTFVYGELAQIGSKMIDFEVKDLQGKPFKLSSLLGKDILLSFWSKGCGPCRMENKKISDNYEKYKDKIAIVSFSIDNNKKYWIDASKEDNIRWTNVSDLEGEIGIIKTKYSVQAIPTSFLINKDGIIIEKFTGFGEKFLSSIENIIK